MKTTLLVITCFIYGCSQDVCPRKDCSDFLSWEEAQVRYNACPEDYGNLFQNPEDTVVCQSWLIDRTRRSNP